MFKKLLFRPFLPISAFYLSLFRGKEVPKWFGAHLENLRNFCVYCDPASEFIGTPRDDTGYTTDYMRSPRFGDHRNQVRVRVFSEEEIAKIEELKKRAGLA